MPPGRVRASGRSRSRLAGLIAKVAEVPELAGCGVDALFAPNVVVSKVAGGHAAAAGGIGEIEVRDLRHVQRIGRSDRLAGPLMRSADERSGP